MKANDVIKRIMNRQPEKRWRIKKGRMTVVSRALIVDTLHKSGKPLCVADLAWLLNKSYQGIARNLRVLENAKVVCDRIDSMESGYYYYTICPVCPKKDECEHPLEIWKNVTE